MVPQKHIKILGMTLDSKLNWGSHIDDVVNKCEKVLNLMRLLSGTKWGAESKPLLQIYQALVRSKLDYGGEILESAAETTKLKLDRVQAKALIIVTGAQKDAATEALHRETGEMPLSLRRNLASVKHLIRCYEVKSELLQEREKWFENSDSSFFSRVEAVVNKLKTKPSSTERFLSKLDPPWAPQLPELTLLPVKDQKWNNFVQIYTDAAKANDSRCSAAFVVPELNVTEWRRLTDGLAIAKCELIAVYLAI